MRQVPCLAPAWPRARRDEQVECLRGGEVAAARRGAGPDVETPVHGLIAVIGAAMAHAYPARGGQREASNSAPEYPRCSTWCSSPPALGNLRRRSAGPQSPCGRRRMAATSTRSSMHCHQAAQHPWWSVARAAAGRARRVVCTPAVGCARGLAPAPRTCSRWRVTAGWNTEAVVGDAPTWPARARRECSRPGWSSWVSTFLGASCALGSPDECSTWNTHRRRGGLDPTPLARKHVPDDREDARSRLPAQGGLWLIRLLPAGGRRHAGARRPER